MRIRFTWQFWAVTIAVVSGLLIWTFRSQAISPEVYEKYIDVYKIPRQVEVVDVVLDSLPTPEGRFHTLDGEAKKFTWYYFAGNPPMPVYSPKGTQTEQTVKLRFKLVGYAVIGSDVKQSQSIKLATPRIAYIGELDKSILPVYEEVTE